MMTPLPTRSEARPLESEAFAAAEGGRGFTLFELLVVMVVIGLCIGAISVLYRSPSSGTRLKTLALVTASRLRDLRASAMSSHSERVANIDTASRTIHFGSGAAPVALDRSIAISLTGAEDEVISPSRANIRFYPNGSSSGATIAFRSNEQTYEIRINWLTGRVATHALQ